MRQKLEVKIKQGDIDIDLVIKFKKKESGIYIENISEGLAEGCTELIDRAAMDKDEESIENIKKDIEVLNQKVARLFSLQNKGEANASQGNIGFCGECISPRKGK